jgi:two-component system, OmpR family, sensor histidine kinase CreC
MSLRLRLLVAFVGMVAAGLLVMARLVVGDVRPHTFGATEESLVETAVVLTSLVEAKAVSGGLPLQDLRTTLDLALHRPLQARIYDVDKKAVELHVYVTDARGIVVYDSDQGRAEGKDFSQWRDVNRALQGRYGARASRRDRTDSFSATFYVALPIRRGDEVVGALAVGKQAQDVKGLLAALNRKIALAGLIALAAAVALSVAVAAWLTRPLEALSQYARAVGEGRRPPLPVLRPKEVAELGTTLESMRDALDGRRDVEGLVRALTHETKAPLSAIRASAELLGEDLPEEDRRRFLESIRAETGRLQRLVDRILELSALEARKSLGDVQPLDLAEVGREVAESARPLAAQKRLSLDVHLDGLPPVPGDRLLVRQALMNLVHNAIRWTPEGGRITAEGRREGEHVVLAVDDTGAGVPDYARDRVFEKFYSVPVPGEGRGTGLGLPFVREVALLHGGEAALTNRPEGGARATLRLSLRTPPGRSKAPTGQKALDLAAQ